MVMSLPTRRFAAWIACLAMLFAALAPSVSHAMSATGGNVWTEICSAAGITMIKAPQGQGDPVDADSASHLEHCAFCATHPTDIVPLPGGVGYAPVLSGRDIYPRLFYQSPSPLAAWTRAHSRAPPQ